MDATPEPWRYEQFERDGLFGFRIMAGEIQIAEAYPRPDQVAVNEANFRLLVAAPRMRRLLNTLLLTGDDLSAVELCRLEARSILRTMWISNVAHDRPQTNDEADALANRLLNNMQIRYEAEERLPWASYRNGILIGRDQSEQAAMLRQATYQEEPGQEAKMGSQDDD